jgi:acyl dehydratase
MTDFYFEDFKVGDVFKSPGMTITESQIIDFAMRYDTQPFPDQQSRLTGV